ncbi:DnaJ-class molecular chaperone [Spinactinospora alkalitolerans]|uniref:DnaJ-class molecular chaperone n=1 Tax=Spinactinospora alkalitolerans TaxID=687207 RepID=A0A852U457_9ACTN|nr:hypothetical protein [Spinactinospora alkalitolerans]NYE48884.1 DnaJ-class molecular chaperone [Spinactinospora alkalitolerans]
MGVGDGLVRVESRRRQCELDACEWCDRDDRPCRFCTGSGRWRPERPHLDGAGVIGWVRVAEECRMCAGTGKEHGPLADPAPERG